jgi:hypothetical protein
LKRVHDRKLSIIAICAVLRYLPQAPPVLTQAAGQLLSGALMLFKELPQAIQGELRECVGKFALKLTVVILG